MLLTAGAAVPPPRVSGAPLYTLQGYVADAPRGRPVAGAIVIASGPAGSVVQTDPRGFYVMHLHAGVYAVTAYGNGYVSRAVQVRAVEGARQNLDLVLPLGRRPGATPDTGTYHVSNGGWSSAGAAYGAFNGGNDEAGSAGGGRLAVGGAGGGNGSSFSGSGSGGGGGGGGSVGGGNAPSAGIGSTGAKGGTQAAGYGPSAGSGSGGTAGLAGGGEAGAVSAASGGNGGSSGTSGSVFSATAGSRAPSRDTLQPVGVTGDGSAVYSPPATPKPDYESSGQFAPFATTVTRVVGDPGTPIVFSSGATGVWNSDARHHYSLDQPWNADQSLIAIDQPGGTPDLLFLDGSTYQPKFPRCSNYDRLDDRWHPTLPHIRINGGGTVLEWFDIVACTRVKSWTLPFPVDYIGRSKGNATPDARLIVLGDVTRMFVVDMKNNKIGPAADITYGATAVDHMGISPTGRFALVHYVDDSQRVFDVNPTTLALTPRPMAVAPACHGTAAAGFIYDLGHEDMTLNPFDRNEDVVIGQEHCFLIGRIVNGRPTGHVVMVRMRDGRVTPLTDPTNEAYAHHISARNITRPGWVYVSYFPYETGMRFNEEIIAVRLDGGAVERWTFHHSDAQGCYRCEVHPVPSPDGLRVLFNSVWNVDCASGCGTQSIRQAYVVDGRP